VEKVVAIFQKWVPYLVFGESGYSGFDSALYRKLEAKWHFSQENATSHKLQMARCESKPL